METFTPLHGKENLKDHVSVKNTPFRTSTKTPFQLTKTPFQPAKTPFQTKTPLKQSILSEKTNKAHTPRHVNPLLKTVLQKTTRKEQTTTKPKKKIPVYQDEEIEYCPPPAVEKPWLPPPEHQLSIERVPFPFFLKVGEKEQEELELLLNSPPEYDFSVKMEDEEINYEEPHVDVDLTLSSLTI